MLFVVVAVVLSQVVSYSLLPHGLQHTRLPCPSLSPRVCSNSCPLSQWCHPTSSSSVTPFSSCLQSFPASGSFPMTAFYIRWPKYRCFSISPSNEYPGLISFRIDRFDLLAVGLFKRLLQHHSLKASNSSALSLLQGPTLTSVQDYWKNHNFDCTDLCWRSDVSAFFSVLFVYLFTLKSEKECSTM